MTIALQQNKYNRLTVLELLHSNKYNQRLVRCRCDCGNIVKTVFSQVKGGHTKSCGCLKLEKAKQRGKLNKTHGKSFKREYNIWRNIMARCTNEDYIGYENYGGRGISHCDKRKAFEGFWEDMQEGYKSHLTIERTNVNGNYCKENCRWATYKEQANNKRNNARLTYKGITKTISQWSDETNISHSVIWARINKLGWTIEKTLSTKTNLCITRK